MGEKFSPWFHRDIYAELAEARETEPVFYSPEAGHWIVTPNADVRAVLHDHDRISSDSATPKARG